MWEVWTEILILVNVEKLEEKVPFPLKQNLDLQISKLKKTFRDDTAQKLSDCL